MQINPLIPSLLSTPKGGAGQAQDAAAATPVADDAETAAVIAETLEQSDSLLAGALADGSFDPQANLNAGEIAGQLKESGLPIVNSDPTRLQHLFRG